MFLKTSFFLDALASFHPFLLDGMDIGRIQGLSSDLELSLDSATYWLCDFSVFPITLGPGISTSN